MMALETVLRMARPPPSHPSSEKGVESQKVQPQVSEIRQRRRLATPDQGAGPAPAPDDSPPPAIAAAQDPVWDPLRKVGFTEAAYVFFSLLPGLFYVVAALQ